MPRDQDIAAWDADFLERVPQEIRGTFTEQQIAAIKHAFRRGHHSVDIRVSLPLPGGRRYLVLLMGKELRSNERRRLERLRQPLLTLMNVITMTTFSALVFFFAVGLVQILFR
jgi:hypothetical protein